MACTTRGWTLLLVVGLLVVTGSSRSPEAKKARYLERGDTYVAHEQHREAILEYRNVSDTLGWIFYKRGVYQRAMGLLKESASKLPDTPVLQYHLGLASLKVGDKESARTALTAAVNSPATFAGKDEAKKALAELR